MLRFLCALLVPKCYIGIEVNKPDAIEALTEKTKGLEGFEVVPLAVKYPQGFKSHLIKAVTGRDVPGAPVLLIWVALSAT